MLNKLKKFTLIIFFVAFTFIAGISPFTSVDRAYATVEDLFTYITNPFQTTHEPFGGRLVKKSYNKFNDHIMNYEIFSTHLSPSTVISSYESALKSQNVETHVTYNSDKDILIGYSVADNLVVINAVKTDARDFTLVKKAWRKRDLTAASCSQTTEIDPAFEQRVSEIITIEDDYIRGQLMMELHEEYYGKSRYNEIADIPGDDIKGIVRYPGARRTNSMVLDAGLARKVTYTNEFSIKANESYYISEMKRNGWIPIELHNRINQALSKDSSHLIFQKDNIRCDLLISTNSNGRTNSTFFVK